MQESSQPCRWNCRSRSTSPAMTARTTPKRIRPSLVSCSTNAASAVRGRRSELLNMSEASTAHMATDRDGCCYSSSSKGRHRHRFRLLSSSGGFIEICSKLRPPDIRGLPCCPLSKLFPNLPATTTEKQLLLDFKAERSYKSGGALATWSAEADMCSWSGVSSCTAEGNVESL